MSQFGLSLNQFQSNYKASVKLSASQQKHYSGTKAIDTQPNNQGSGIEDQN